MEKDDDANIIHQIDGDDQRQRAVSTADYGSPVPVPDGYAVRRMLPRAITTAGQARRAARSQVQTRTGSLVEQATASCI